MLVGEHTKDSAPEFVYRELDLVRVKGKDKPVAIFEPLGLIGEVGNDELNEIKLFNQLLRSIVDGNGKKRTQLFNLQKFSPDNKLYQVYSERIAFFRNNSPGENWDGAFDFKTK